MNIIKGKQQRPQRVVIYGVESVGKSTFAAQFPKPLFLDIEGGTAHLDVDRVAVDSWKQLGECIAEVSKTDYGTVVIDSADWAERLAVEDLLAANKKQSVEDFGFGKGWVMAAEKVSRFLGALDRLIEGGKNVVVIAHSKVQRTEPPDILAAYDRYELKLSKQSSPLVKEWADELWFFRFKTKSVTNDGGKAKGIGGKERVIYTTHSAAYDAKTRSGLPDEIPMEWSAVAHLFQPVAPKTSAPAVVFVEDWQVPIEENEDAVNAFLVANKSIQLGQTYRDVSERLRAQIAARPEALVAKAKAAQMEVAA
jgi:broad specificity phosphatase PhoE